MGLILEFGTCPLYAFVSTCASCFRSKRNVVPTLYPNRCLEEIVDRLEKSDMRYEEFEFSLVDSGITPSNVNSSKCYAVLFYGNKYFELSKYTDT